jgi:predicted transcriptional regulator
MSTTIELDDDLYAKIEAQAKLREISPTLLIRQILRSQLDEFRQLYSADSQRNWAAFRRQLPDLLQTHVGQYVAIVNGQIVGYGNDRIALLKDMRAQYGRLHILVTEVTPQLRVRHIPYRKTVR